MTDSSTLSRVRPYLVIILVGAPEHHEFPDELVRVGDAVVALAIRQDLRPSCRDAWHLVRFGMNKIKFDRFDDEKKKN